MIKCPACGFNNLDDQAHCVRCHAGLAEKRVSFGRPALAGPRNALARLLRPPLLAFYRVRAFFDQPPDMSLPHRGPFLAGWLSLVPGGGQIYNGQPRVALLHFGLFAALVASGVALILSRASDFLFLGAACVVIYSMKHALIEAQVVNGSTILWVGARRWRVFFLFLALVALLMWAIQFFALAWIATFLLLATGSVWLAAMERRGGSLGGQLTAFGVYFAVGALAFGAMFLAAPLWMWRSVIRLQWHGQVAHAPLIERGDRLLIEGVSEAWRPFQIGDIVYYDPARYRVEIGEDLHLVNMASNVERIVGLPGDTFELRGGVFLRNGQPVPEREQPIARGELPWEFRVEAPPGHYVVVSGYGPIEWSVVGVRKAAPPPRGELERISVVPAGDIFGRVVMIYRPWHRRAWLTKEPPPESAPR